MADRKNLYQVVLIFNPKIEEKQKEDIFKKIDTWMGSSGAAVVKKDHMGQKQMVYKIKGNSTGDYWTLDLESDKPLKLRDLSIYFNREVNIIRYLVLKK